LREFAVLAEESGFKTGNLGERVSRFDFGDNFHFPNELGGQFRFGTRRVLEEDNRTPHPEFLQGNTGACMPIVLENAPRPKQISPKPLSMNQALAHDARNALASLQVYSELLAQPGVLAVGREHYARELGVIVETSLRLIEKLTVAAEIRKPSSPIAKDANYGKDSSKRAGSQIEVAISVTNDTYPNSNFSELSADANEARCLECR
jgi:hypothetical protein